ncbi:MAG TPA: ABC transporter permease [Longimicrobiales bacterium]|nr:ABC transporter permease [Longimicrobiales bacterium]
MRGADGSAPAAPELVQAMANLLTEIRYALRAIRGAPGFSLTVIATLGIGLGATVAIFSVVNALLLRPLPFPDSDRMVMVWQDLTRRGGPDKEWFTPPDFVDLRDGTSSFAALAAVGNYTPAMTTPDGAESVDGVIVSAGYFDVVGVRPVIGAPFHPDTEQPGAVPVVVLGHDIWQSRFAGDASAVGRTITLNDVAHEIVGVMPAGFRDPLFPADVWRSRVVDANGDCGRGCYSVRVIGRLQPNTPVATAAADANVVAARLAAEYASNRDVAFNVVGLKDDVTAATRPALLALAGAVALLLLIAIVNVANLLVARAGVRDRELAIRTAIGAGRGTVVRQMLVETVVLGAIGAAAAALIALWAVALLTALAPPNTPRIDEVTIDATSLSFALGAGIIAALAAAIGPALHATAGQPADVLRETGGHRVSVGRRRVRSALVVAEIAIALTLLIGSGLTLRSLARLQQVDPGFRADGLVTGQYFLPPARYETADEIRVFVATALERVAALPGVAGVATTSSLPMSGVGDSDVNFRVEGRVPGRDENPPAAWYRSVSRDWFEVTGTPITAGRAFNAEDRAGNEVRAAIINETFRRRHFPGEDPVGRRLAVGGDPFEIVGVTADTRHRGLGSETIVELFLSAEQVPARSNHIVVRLAGGPVGRSASTVAATTGASVRDVVRAIDPALPPPAFRAMTELVTESIALPRLYSAFFTFFALVALLLAGVGVYGLTAYTVGQRRQEIGIRVALGARAKDVTGMVVRQSMRLAGAGLVLGLAAAALLARPVAGLLHDVGPYDLVTFAGVPAMLGGIALLACWLPARRAARLDPVAALRPD